MASPEHQTQHQRPHLPVEIDEEKLKKAFDISHFDLNAVLRGAQLTLVGGTRETSLFHAPSPPPFAGWLV